VNERPIEYRFVFQNATRLAPKTVLDVGTGTTALPHLLRNCGFHVTAIDNVRDYWSAGTFFNRHYHVIDDDIRQSSLSGPFDYITCISVLEHIPEHDRAIDSMFRLLSVGGHLALTFPYNEQQYIENAYKLPDAGYGQSEPYVCQIYSRSQVSGWVDRNGGEIVEQEYWEAFTGPYWTVGQRLHPPKQTEVSQKHHLSCLLIRKKA
jgi:2-polyprenyl-3-methyl-5-hydroxy-6-metoxy-1,4-benzoquinol methylase